VLADAGSIPAISTNNKGHLFFRWPFLLVGLAWMKTQVPGSKKSYGMIFHEPCILWRTRRGSYKEVADKKSSGTIFNVRFLHGPEGSHMDVGC